MFIDVRDRNRSEEGGIIFIDNKTFIINLILSSVRKENGIAISTVSLGIAAALLKLGSIVNSHFRLPIYTIPAYPESTSTTYDLHKQWSRNNVIKKSQYFKRALQRSQIFCFSGRCYAHMYVTARKLGETS